jgi:hypothetical protein
LRYCDIDSRPEASLDSKHLALVILVAMSVNTYRLYRKRQRRAPGSYDGQESRVTSFDVWFSAAFSLALLGVCSYEWLLYAG